jgi:nitrile hydratase subunit beta
MGGMHGFGPVKAEPGEPPFHAEWERRIFALTLAMGRPGGWSLDMSRAARESLSPLEYLSKSYYEIWLFGLERLMTERGLVTEDEIASGRVLYSPRAVGPPLSPDDVAGVVHGGAPTVRKASAPARYQPGDKVRAKNLHPHTHTRLPRYVRGHIGFVEHVHGCHVFPDSHAAGAGESPQWLYTVRFDGHELWGVESDPSVKVSVDAWEPYLEPG